LPSSVSPGPLTSNPALRQSAEKQVSVIDVQVERATADGLLVAVSEVNRQLVAMCERIDLVVKGDRETELPVVLDGACDAATSKQGS
jgi:hypothetical protein